MMNYLLANFAFASVIAVAAFLASRITRNAALLHLFWVAVLLRLVVPPVVDIPIGGSFKEQEASFAGVAVIDNHLVGSLSQERSWPKADGLLWLIWSAGSTSVVVTAIARSLRFQRLVQRTAIGDSDLDKQVRAVASQMGLSRIPKAYFMPARISPMVWTWFGGPLLLLPSEFWNSLSSQERTVIIKHELAHLLRRDHWVRFLETLATVTHWWCPVLWWARRELHRYEEHCCDGWAASAGTDAKTALARACLLTVDFVGQETPHGLDFGVTQMAGFVPLRRRIQFIFEGDRMYSMNRHAALASFVALLCIVGATPSFGQTTDAELRERPERLEGRQSDTGLHKERLEAARKERPDSPSVQIPANGRRDDGYRLRRLANKDEDLTRYSPRRNRSDSSETDLRRRRIQHAKSKRGEVEDPFGGVMPAKRKMNVNLERISITRQARSFIGERLMKAIALEEQAEELRQEAARHRDHAKMLEEKLQSHLKTLEALPKS